MLDICLYINRFIVNNLHYGSGNSNIPLYARWDAPSTALTQGLVEKREMPEVTPVSANESDTNKSDIQDIRSSGAYPLQTLVYEYANVSWGDQLTVIKTYTVSSTGIMTLSNTRTFAYDSMGNAVSYGNSTLAWEGKQVVSHSTGGSGGKAILTTFAYDENGLRTQKIYNSVTTTNYYYNGSILMGMVTGTGTTAIHQLFSYDASGNVVSVDYSSDGGSTFATYYYVRNAQNDVVKLIDSSGATVVEYAYDTWGKLLSTTGSLASTLGVDQPFRYRGYVYDTETGWYYLQSRYYDPSIGRFISADVYLSTGQDVHGCNTFIYCGNNPINRIDPDGESWLLIAIALGLLMTTVALTGCDESVSSSDALDGMYFRSMEEAATYAANSIIDNPLFDDGYGPELGYYICSDVIDGETQYFVYSTLYIGENGNAVLMNPKGMNPGYEIVATIHSHSYSTNGDYRIFSEDRGGIGDAYFATTYGYCYLISPDRKLYRMNKGVASRYKEYDPQFPMSMFFVKNLIN